MAKRPKPRTFDEVLSLLGNEKFNVGPAVNGANRVSKYGVAAEIAPAEAKDATVRVVAKAGWVLNGEISRLTDKGYQKFLRSSTLEIPATADKLNAIHTFSEELKEAVGALNLYNEALGTTSDRYVYDRVKGRA